MANEIAIGFKVSNLAGIPVYAYSCATSFTPTYALGRFLFVDPVSGKKVYGITHNASANQNMKYLGIDPESGKPVYAWATCSFEKIEDDVCGCPASPIRWLLAGPTLTNDSCLDCHIYGGSTVLTYIPANGYWFGPFVHDEVCGTPTSGDEHIVTLLCDGTNWVLDFPYVGVTYTQSAAAWNCLSANTLNLAVTPGDHCQGWPGTLTVTPA